MQKNENYMTNLNIENYFEHSSKLSSGAQPNIEQIAELKQNNFEVVVNISTQSARNAVVNEAQIVEQQNMIYVHFPVDCSNLQDFHYQAFKSILKSFDARKCFVHCGANIKSSNLIHMYQVLELGIDEENSFKQLNKIQTPEQKWFNYFKENGMIGVGEFMCLNKN